MAIREKMLNLNDIISNATIRNWTRLSFSVESKLSSRANKKLSKKIFIPVEYFCNEKNIPIIQDIIDFVWQHQYTVEDTIFSFAINLLSEKKLLFRPHVQKIISEYNFAYYQELNIFELPNDEMDLLGIIYQCLLTEGEKNRAGAYYTSFSITSQMIANLDFSKGQTFFDPCCGSGAFFLALNNILPTQIYAIDNNPIAVFIAKINMLLKFSDYEFSPQIFCCDYLDENMFHGLDKCLRRSFDYIVTNPPWGAVSSNVIDESIIKSKETFSLFYVKAYKQLNKNGIMRFLLPEAILNVKAHKDIREFILKNGDLKQISFYSNTFSGVTTKIVDIMQQKYSKTSHVDIKKNNSIFTMPISAFSQTKNKVFTILDKPAIAIIEKIKSIGVYHLDNSIWALGIVTGDNKTKLKQKRMPNYEAIYTGKEITQYRLKPVKNYIMYNRSQLQQVAKDEYYRAEEKLVYKFISNKLIFAYDNTGSLFLNSANILIPNIPNMSIKTVLAFLNSQVFQWLYRVLFSEIKVLKGNLIELPFPKITQEQDKNLNHYVQNVLGGNDDYIEQIQDKIYDIFGISELQKKYIEEFMYGMSNK